MAKPKKKPAQAKRETEVKKLGRPRVYASDMPVYDSMAQMSAALQIPLASLAIAKREGCLFVRHGRCDSGEFIAWWFKQGDKDDEDGSGVNWADRDKRASALIKETKLDEDRGKTINFGVAGGFIRYLVTVGFFGELARMENEFPASLKGKDEIGIKTEISKQSELIKQNLTKRINKWIEKKGKE